MEKKTQPVKPDKVPTPPVKRETIEPIIDPEEPLIIVPEEAPDLIPDDEPFETPPYEIPPLGEGP
jgi:hypothetical protein